MIGIPHGIMIVLVSIVQRTAQFLAAPRDIKHYVDIFSGRR